MKKYIRFFQDLLKKIKQDRATSLAAEQSYYYTLAIFPLMILILSIIPYLSISSTQIIDLLQPILPKELVHIFEKTILQIFEAKHSGVLTIGIVTTLWSASSGIGAFISSMNIAYETIENRNYVTIKIISVFLTLCLVLAFITMLVLPVFGHILLQLLKTHFLISRPISFILNILRWVISIAVIGSTLSVMYYLAPNTRYAFKAVIPGAFITTILWLLTSVGFSFYVNHFGHYSATYGSLGGMIVLMLWFYLSGLIFVIGGEVNALLHREQTSFSLDQTITILS